MSIHYYACNEFIKRKLNFLLIVQNHQEAIASYKQLERFFSKANIYYLPNFDALPYDRMSISPNNSCIRASTLAKLATDLNPKFLILEAANLFNKLPQQKQLKEFNLKLSVNTSFEDLKNQLFLLNFRLVDTARALGDFAIKGEIFDIVGNETVGHRISLSWNQIESIRIFDLNSQLSIKAVESVTIYPYSEIPFYNIDIFKQNFLQIFGITKTDSYIYEAITLGKKINGIENFRTLFLNEYTSIFDYIINPIITLSANLNLQKLEDHINESYLVSNLQLKVPTEKMFFNCNEIQEQLNKYEPYIPKIIYNIPNFYQDSIKFKCPITSLIIPHTKNKTIVISDNNRLKSALEKEQYQEIGLLDEARKNVINFIDVPIDLSFSFDDYMFLSLSDLHVKELPAIHKSSAKQLQDIIIELEHLNVGELVVHANHGIAKFCGNEQLIVDNIVHDFVKLLYANDDKLFIPVENLDVIKKYGFADAPLDKLGSSAWQKRKAASKHRIIDIADKLINAVAERKIKSVDSMILDQQLYNEFCDRFPHPETDDQLTAITDIINDLSSGKLMDRLICGDVGFGKTEVAMRAAFIIARIMKAQVIVLCPTTILARQHFNTFSARFHDFGITIAELSRFNKKSNHKHIKEEARLGNIDILIGTHAVFDLSMNNLGLCIIDEEQHFGVEQKEMLRKQNVHILSMSATPIPRTLQMSLVGIRDLSLITTPPMDRLPINTIIDKSNKEIIREALLKEHMRNGQSFYVVPRVKDLEEEYKILLSLVPELNVRMAHGQMPPDIIEKVMQDFYNGIFDVLVATSIIESGVDIPNVNTIIIAKSEMFGLSQLHQLRGRIGRAKVKSYAYLLYSAHVTKAASSKLEILATANTLGAGFMIASHDMDHRGFGNLVGKEQSGYVKEVGIELYQEMLEKAISHFQHPKEPEQETINISINLGTPIYIPKEYIERDTLRIAIYRRAANLKTAEEIENFKLELIDRFGLIPEPFINLLEIIKIKQLCNKYHIIQLDANEHGIIIKFRQTDSGEKIALILLNKYQKIAKVRPDNKLVLLMNSSAKDRIETVRNILLDL